MSVRQLCTSVDSDSSCGEMTKYLIYLQVVIGIDNDSVGYRGKYIGLMKDRQVLSGKLFQKDPTMVASVSDPNSH